MAKRIGFNPLILLGDTPDDDTVTGGGTGQGGLSGPPPLSHTAWLQSQWYDDFYDFDRSGSVSLEEYANWWEDWGFDHELFEQVYGVAWNPEWII